MAKKTAKKTDKKDKPVKSSPELKVEENTIDTDKKVPRKETKKKQN